MVPSWYGVMPVIELASGTPVVFRFKGEQEVHRGIWLGCSDDRRRLIQAAIDHGMDGKPADLLVAFCSTGQGWLLVTEREIDWMRVDLGNPLGLGHAIWWLAGKPWMPPVERQLEHADMAGRYMLRRTTDADLLGVASACREMS